MSAASAPHSNRPPLVLWLFLATWLVAIAAVLAAASWIDGLVRQQARTEAQHFLQSHALALSTAFDRGMAQHLQAVRMLAATQQLGAQGDWARVRSALDAFKTNLPQFAWVGVADANGQVVAAADGLLQGADVSARPWFQAARRGAPYVGDVHRALLLEHVLPRQREPWRFVDFALPIVDAAGTLRGVLGAHLSWQWGAELKRDLSDRLTQERGAQALVVGAHDEVLLGPAGTEGHALRTDDPGYLWARALTTGHAEFKGLGWTVVLRQPVQLAMAPYDQLHAKMLAVAAVLCLLLTPVLWWVALRLAAPLHELTRALDEFAFVREPRKPLPYREADLLQQALAEHDARQAQHAAELEGLAADLERRVVERTAALADSERRLADVLGNLPAMVGHFDRDERCLFANGLALRVHGLSREQALGRRLQDGLSTQAYRLHAPYVARVLAGESVSFEGQEPRRGGEAHYRVHLVPQRDDGGQVVGFYLMTFDITAMKQAQALLERSEARLKAIADNLPVMISYIDAQYRLQFANRTFAQWTGIAVESALGRSLPEVVGSHLYEQREPALRQALGGERVEFELASTVQGVLRHLHTIYVPDGPPGGTRGVYTLTMDVTALREAEQRMAALALHDALTGLANRRRLDDRLPEALARGRRNGTGTAVFFLDVDRFKSINDTHGHACGDAVLVQFAQRLKASVRGTDLVARLAGDEFVVVLEGLHKVAEAEALAGKIVAAAREPMSTPTCVLQVTTSLGAVYVPPDRAVTGDEVLKRADEALYRTKQRGRDGYTCTSAGPA